MNHVWLQCEALVKQELDKIASGRQDDELHDALLSQEEYQLVTVTFMVKYDWHPPAKRMVRDSRLGKIRRQFLNGAVTLKLVSRTTCLTDSSRGHEPKRPRVGMGNPVASHLEWFTHEVDAVPCRDTRSFLRLFKRWLLQKNLDSKRNVVCSIGKNVMRGTAQLTKSPGNGSSILVMLLPTRKSLQSKNGSVLLLLSLLVFLPMPWIKSRVEGAGWCQGGCVWFKKAIKHKPVLLTHCSRRYQARNATNETQEGQSGHKVGFQASLWQKMASGSFVCKAVNDKRGRTGLQCTCSKGHHHVCGILLPCTNACCGSKLHTRAQPKEVAHSCSTQGRLALQLVPCVPLSCRQNAPWPESETLRDFRFSIHLHCLAGSCP